GIVFTTQLDKSSFPVRVFHAIYFCGATDSFHRERVVITFLDREYSHYENCEKESHTNRHITKSLLTKSKLFISFNPRRVFIFRLIVLSSLDSSSTRLTNNARNCSVLISIRRKAQQLFFSAA